MDAQVHHQHSPPPNHLQAQLDSYTFYLDPSFPIDDRFDAALVEFDISAETARKMRALLAPLQEKHSPTYEHCIRVGLIAARIASFQNLDVKALFIAGVLHDIGKAQCPLWLLEKTSGWNAEDAQLMQQHVLDGYRLARDIFDFGAEILLWHHRFQRCGYPDDHLPHLHPYSRGTQTLIPLYGRTLALADSYDALHRINDHHGTRRALTGPEIKEKMLEYHPDRRDLIEALFRSDILTTYIVGQPHMETIALDSADVFHDKSFTHAPEKRTPGETRRFLELSCALEATLDKHGCTTRYQDISRHLKLAYFVTAGVNIGDAFQALGEHLDDSPDMLPNCYSYAYRAQLESKRNRRGGRVNQGMIELLLPIVVAQHLHDPSYAMTEHQILEHARDYLARTTRKDVEQLIEMKRLAFDLSHYNDRTVPEHASAESVAQYYRMDLAHSESATSIAHNNEFVSGFPTLSLMLSVLRESLYPSMTTRLEEAYQRACLMHGPSVGKGFLADCSAVSLYLRLSQNPRARLIG